MFLSQSSQGVSCRWDFTLIRHCTILTQTRRLNTVYAYNFTFNKDIRNNLDESIQFKNSLPYSFPVFFIYSSFFSCDFNINPEYIDKIVLYVWSDTVLRIIIKMLFWVVTTTNMLTYNGKCCVARINQVNLGQFWGSTLSEEIKI